MLYQAIIRHEVHFAKKDILVLLGCAVFLLLNIGAIGSSGRKRTKEMVCLSNLRQWGTIFSIYMQDNEGYFAYGDSSGSWRWLLQDQHRDRMLNSCCPEAVNPERNSGTYGAWGGESLDDDYVM